MLLLPHPKSSYHICTCAIMFTSPKTGVWPVTPTHLGMGAALPAFSSCGEGEVSGSRHWWEGAQRGCLHTPGMGPTRWPYPAESSHWPSLDPPSIGQGQWQWQGHPLGWAGTVMPQGDFCCCQIRFDFCPFHCKVFPSGYKFSCFFYTIPSDCFFVLNPFYNSPITI